MDGQEIVKYWKAWIKSDEGLSCLTEGASGVYLLNRLERAFIAGIEAAEFSLASQAVHSGNCDAS